MQTHTHASLQKHLCPTLLTLSASFPERHIKGYVHSRAMCSLKCSRAATDPQILTFKPSGEKGEQQGEREREMERRKRYRHKPTNRQTDGGKGFCCNSGGCCQIYDSRPEFAAAKYVFVNC